MFTRSTSPRSRLSLGDWKALDFFVFVSTNDYCILLLGPPVVLLAGFCALPTALLNKRSRTGYGSKAVTALPASLQSRLPLVAAVVSVAMVVCYPSKSHQKYTQISLR
ncbi:unnamed protein product [Ectocarpus fasciculatus]